MNHPALMWEVQWGSYELGRTGRKNQSISGGLGRTARPPLTLQNQHSEGNPQQLDGGVDPLAADGQLVDVLHRLPAETRGAVHGHHLAVGVWRRERGERGGLRFHVGATPRPRRRLDAVPNLFSGSPFTHSIAMPEYGPRDSPAEGSDDTLRGAPLLQNLSHFKSFLSLLANQRSSQRSVHQKRLALIIGSLSELEERSLLQTYKAVLK